MEELTSIFGGALNSRLQNHTSSSLPPEGREYRLAAEGVVFSQALAGRTSTCEDEQVLSCEGKPG